MTSMRFDYVLAEPFRPSSSVAMQPITVLEFWAVMRVHNFGDFLIGIRPDTHTWRRSTPIARLLPVERWAATASGRLYVLAGPPAEREDGEVGVHASLRASGVRDAINVTDWYWAAMQDAFQ